MILRRRGFNWAFLAPRYWPVGLGLGLMKLMAALPFRWQLAAGDWIGRRLSHIARRRRRIAAINVDLCFPELSPDERAALLEAHFAALGMGLFEIAMAWWTPDEELRNRVQVSGAEYLEQALARGKGVILLTGHFTTLELGARLMTLQQSFHAMYRPHKNPLYESAQRHQREWRCRLPPLRHEDLRGVLRALKRGRAVWYAPDQNHGLRNSVGHFTAGGVERCGGNSLLSPAVAGSCWLRDHHFAGARKLPQRRCCGGRDPH